mgnify:FL=1
MNNLSKEEFWDKLYEKYPEEVQRFYDWIDEYKKREWWTNFFKEGVKYHNLPHFYQADIFIIYLAELDNCPFSDSAKRVLNVDYYAKFFMEYFEYENGHKDS